MAMGLSSDNGRLVTRGSLDGDVPLPLPFWIRRGDTWTGRVRVSFEGVSVNSWSAWPLTSEAMAGGISTMALY